MRYEVLATDYDGTIAFDGRVDEPTIAALGRAKAEGLRLVLVLAAIRDLGLEWHVIFNKGCVMALPADVTKATGLVPALGVLGVSADRTVGVGDAENDQAFLRMCGLAVAVDNALPAVKEMADVVTAGARGAGVSELIARLLAGEFETLVRRR
jgi:hydroxymethylpyrimidine pyrophosphatase-like HAD family hydrolase